MTTVSSSITCIKIITLEILLFITISCNTNATIAVLMPQNFYTTHSSQHLSKKEIIQALNKIKKIQFPQNSKKINFIIRVTKNTCNNNEKEAKKHIQNFVKKNVPLILDLTCEKTFVQSYKEKFLPKNTVKQESKFYTVVITPIVTQNILEKLASEKNGLNNFKIISTAVSHTDIQVTQASFLQNKNSVSLVHDGIPYAKSAVNTLHNRLKDLNTTSTIYKASPPKRQDFTKIIEKIINSSSSAVVFEGLGPNAIRFSQQLRAANFDGILLLPNTVDTPTFLEDYLYVFPQKNKTYIARINSNFLKNSTNSSVKEFFLWHKTLLHNTNLKNTEPSIEILQIYSALQLAIPLTIEKKIEKNNWPPENKKYKLILGELYFDKHNIIKDIYTIVNLKNL